MALEVARDAEQHVWDIAEREDITAKAAVFYSLSARHVKRIASHLGNIDTAVIQPVDWLDYTDEPHFSEAEAPPEEE